MSEEPRTHNILVLHPDAESVDRLVESLEERSVRVTVAPDTEVSLAQPFHQRFDMILFSDGISTRQPVEFLRSIKSSPLTRITPVVTLIGPKNESPTIIAEWVLQGAETAVPESMNPGDISDLLKRLLLRFDRERLDPVCILPSGPVAQSMLEQMCIHSETSWTLLAVKLLSVQAFNIAYSYDDGDRLLRSFARTLEEVVSQMGDGLDFTARLHGSLFCIVTRNRSLDSMCRSILSKTERMIRGFYSAFELMKGYLTIEEGAAAGDYHLCEPIIAGLQLPPHWDRNHVYLLDLAEELLADVLEKEAGFRIISL